MGQRGGNQVLSAAQAQAHTLGYADVRAAVTALSDLGIPVAAIAARLDVTVQAVRYHRQKLGFGQPAKALHCEACALAVRCKRRVMRGRPAYCERFLRWERDFTVVSIRQLRAMQAQAESLFADRLYRLRFTQRSDTTRRHGAP